MAVLRDGSRACTVRMRGADEDELLVGPDLAPARLRAPRCSPATRPWTERPDGPGVRRAQQAGVGCPDRSALSAFNAEVSESTLISCSPAGGLRDWPRRSCPPAPGTRSRPCPWR